MSEMPPYSSDRSSGNKTLKIVLIIVGAFLVLCLLAFGACFMFGMKAMEAGGGMVGCTMSTKMAYVSMEAYAKEHDGKLPAAATWQDDIQPYYTRLYDKNAAEINSAPGVGKMFKFSAPGEAMGCKFGDRETGIAFNSALGGQVLEKISNRASTPILFEVPSKARNANEEFKARPDSEAPKIMNQERPWLIFYANGEINEKEFESGNSNMHFNIDLDDAIEGDGTGTPAQPEKPAK